MGVNHDKYDPAKHKIVSNASCTTNCLAPVAKVINDNFGLDRRPDDDRPRRDRDAADAWTARARRTGAAAAARTRTSSRPAPAPPRPSRLVLPELKGKLTGMAFRVPTPDVSVVDLTFKTAKATSYKEICAAMKAASEGELKGILGYTDDEVVSSDFIARRAQLASSTPAPASS